MFCDNLWLKYLLQIIYLTLGLSMLGRPKRACTSMIQSYQEPCLQR